MRLMTKSPFADLNFTLGRRVAETLQAYDPEVFGKLDVTVRGNVVFLNGLIVGKEKHAMALEVAMSTEGVAKVVDHVQVRPAPSRQTALDVSVSTAMPQEPLWQRALGPAFVTFVVATAVGWGASAFLKADIPEGIKLVAVDGSVFFEDEPAAGALLTFYPVKGAETELGRLEATADSDGRFTIRANDQFNGAPPGRYLVTVYWRPKVVDGEDYKPGGNVIPERFANPRTTPLVVEVSSQDSPVSLPPFRLGLCPNTSRNVF